MIPWARCVCLNVATLPEILHGGNIPCGTTYKVRIITTVIWKFKLLPTHSNHQETMFTTILSHQSFFMIHEHSPILHIISLASRSSVSTRTTVLSSLSDLSTYQRYQTFCAGNGPLGMRDLVVVLLRIRPSSYQYHRQHFLNIYNNSDLIKVRIERT